MRSLLLAFLLISPAVWAAPTVEDGTVLRPRFVTEQGTFSAGTAFALEVNGKILVVTALHLFGPAGGLEAQIDGDKVPGFTRSIKLRDAFTGGDYGTAHKGLTLADTHPMGDDAVGDIAAFEAKILRGLDKLDSKAKALTPIQLAAAAPKKGDIVHVAAQFADDRDTRTYPAKVVQINAKWLFFEYVNPDLDLSGTSGAPVLNEAGEVVGVNLGGGKMDDGKLIGSANPLPAVKKRLTEAMSTE